MHPGGAPRRGTQEGHPGGAPRKGHPGRGTQKCTFQPFFVVLGLTEEKKQILEDYHKTHNDEIMDINLLISLISDIHQKTDLTEAILVFLPGYEEIVNVKENLEHNVSNMKICMLHSQLNSRVIAL